MKESVLLETDVDERRLQVVLKVLNAPLEHASDQALFFRMLHHELLESPVFHDGNARLQFFDVNYDLALHL